MLLLILVNALVCDYLVRKKISSLAAKVGFITNCNIYYAMFSLERLKKTGEEISKVAVSAANGVKDASIKVASATVFAVKTTASVTNTVIIRPSTVALKQLWPVVDMDKQIPGLQSCDNGNMALFRTAIDGGMDPAFFHRLLNFNAKTTLAPPNFRNLKQKVLRCKIMVLKDCKICSNISCGIYCCGACERRIRLIDEAYDILTMKQSEKSKEYEIFFVKHAIVHRKMLRYNW